MISLDVQMPGVSGLEILALIRNMCPHAVIAIISGHIGGSKLPEIAGCADLIIQKPVSPRKSSVLLTGAQHMCNHLNEIRGLGEISVPSYRVGSLANE